MVLGLGVLILLFSSLYYASVALSPPEVCRPYCANYPPLPYFIQLPIFDLAGVIIIILGLCIRFGPNK